MGPIPRLQGPPALLLVISSTLYVNLVWRQAAAQARKGLRGVVLEIWGVDPGALILIATLSTQAWLTPLHGVGWAFHIGPACLSNQRRPKEGYGESHDS